MRKTTAQFIFSAFLLLCAAMGVLYETGKLERLLPTVDHFLDRHLPEKIDPLAPPNGGGPFREVLKSPEKAYKKQLKKYLTKGSFLETPAPKRYRDKQGSDIIFNFRTSAKNPPDRVFSWNDARGVTHFSNVRPEKDNPSIREIPWGG